MSDHLRMVPPRGIKNVMDQKMSIYFQNLKSKNFPLVKGTVFFSPAKVRGPFIHSKSKILFFFPAKWEKKYTLFSKKKFMGHSFNFGQGLTFFIEDWVVFFFARIFVCFFCIFFSRKVHLPFIHSISRLFFFRRRHFHSSNRFFPKVW